MRRLLRSWLLALLALVAAGCARGPDETELASDVQARLDALFGRSVLVLRRVNRQVSASFGAAPGGAKQAIVYFNATVEFVEAYDPSDWEGLSPQLIAAAVGATDEGVIGLATGAVAPGSLLRAYGSIVYRLEGGVWRAADVQLPQTPAVRPTVRGAQGTRAHELMQRLAQIVDSSPGVGGADAAILGEELDRALQNIRLRLDHGSTGVVIATGPRGGEYERSSRPSPRVSVMRAG